MARKISKRQQQLYDYIRAYQQEKGYPPSVREMAAAVGLSSPSTVHAHLSALEARGLIKRDATKPRALELFNEDGSSVSLAEVKESPDRGTVTLPLVGRVAAGMPILAEQNVEDTFTLPTELDVEKIKADPLAIGSATYDFVMDGCEAGGGGMRIHNAQMQLDMLELMGFSVESAREQFGFLMDALEYGAPPMGGFALGLDRVCMLLAGEDSIRDVMAFPKTSSGSDLMSDAPSEVSGKQLKEVGLRLL